MCCTLWASIQVEVTAPYPTHPSVCSWSVIRSQEGSNHTAPSNSRCLYMYMYVYKVDYSPLCFHLVEEDGGPFKAPPRDGQLLSALTKTKAEDEEQVSRAGTPSRRTAARRWWRRWRGRRGRRRSPPPCCWAACTADLRPLWRRSPSGIWEQPCRRGPLWTGRGINRWTHSGWMDGKRLNAEDQRIEQVWKQS